MDSAIGICGDEFVLIGSDMTQIRSIVVLKSDEEKIVDLDSHKIMSLSGPNGDRVAFSEYIKKNIALYTLRHDAALSTHAAANFTRKELANALRSDPYQVNLLIGGWDHEQGPALYYMDYLASMAKVPFAAHGYASFFVSGLLDRLCKSNMKLDEAREVMAACVKELSKRFLVNAEQWSFKVVDKDGARYIDL
jgi:20S proteasome subunit beta 4